MLNERTIQNKKDSLGKVTDYNNGKGFACVENINKMSFNDIANSCEFCKGTIK